MELLGERNVIFKTTELDAGQSTVTMKLEEESKSVNWRLFSPESNSLDDRGELFVKVGTVLDIFSFFGMDKVHFLLIPQVCKLVPYKIKDSHLDIFAYFIHGERGLAMGCSCHCGEGA